MATDKLNKAYDSRAHTSEVKNSWQEFFTRNATVPSAALEAAEVVSGLAGSWTAFVVEDLNVSQGGSTSPLVSPQVKTWKVGQPGLPEINFVPYNHGTNRFASKGPSFLGHPISMSIVGPTLKSPHCTWQWLVTDYSGTPGTGDELTLDTTHGILSTVGTPVAPVATTISDAYGITSAENLYLVISQTGATAEVGGSAATGLSDGFVFDASVGKYPLTPKNDTSKYEIFRVVAVRTDTLVLDPSKRLADYFDFPGSGTACVRAITLFEPHTTRLIGLPAGKGAGKERTFVVVPPKTAATSDLLPPWIVWANGGFDPYDATLVGGSDYDEKVALPIPRPLAKRLGRVQRDNGTNIPIFVEALRGVIEAVDHSVSADDVGKVLHVTRIIRTGDADFRTLGDEPLPQEALLGWFEVDSVDVGRNEYHVRRVAEVDPATGKYHFGSSRLLILDNSVEDGDLQLEFTVHDAVSSLYTSAQLDLDLVESARLKNLIDPAWVKRSLKQTTVLGGSRASRADKAIWDTSSSGAGAPGTNANPGSLLDLGFRMVLFPAKEGVDEVIPDYDRPITSRDVVLDPSNSEAQYIEVDYASGMVHLSHTPVAGDGCDVAPHGIIETSDNPRREIVLFAACVPYSMEPGQRGPGFRVTAAKNTSDSRCSGDAFVTDVYSERLVAPLMYQVEGVAQTITSGSALVLDLAPSDEADALPSSGFIELRRGSEYGEPLFTGADGENLSVFGYYAKETITDVFLGVQHVRLYGVYGGGDSSVPDKYTLEGEHDVVAVFRRDVRTPVDATTGAPGTAYEHDTTYGFAKRTSTLTFQDATLRHKADGSVEVVPYDAAGHEALHGELFQSWLISGGVVSAATGLDVQVAEGVTLIEGVRSITKMEVLTLGANANTYVYYDGSEPTCPVLATASSLPLPSRSDVLLALVVTGASTVTSVTDLRNPLVDLDKRLDILVGQAGGVSETPHFTTLADAVDYCSEIMDPTNGDNGSFLRIKVVGYTTETRQTVIKTNGLIIEGAALRMDGGTASPDTPTAIQWSANDCLIDLNGKWNLTFRNLVFKHTATSDLVDPDRYVFGNLSPDPSVMVTIENCRFTGDKLHGMMFLDAGGLLYSKIRDNYCEPTDFGIYTSADFAHNVLQGNLITANSVSQNALALGAAIHLASATSENNIIENNVLEGFVQGVYTQGAREVIRSNQILDTLLFGIHTAGSDSLIEGNVLADVHTDAAVVSQKIGIWSEEASGAKVISNLVTISGGVAGDYAVSVVGASALVQGNSLGLTLGIYAGADARVLGNEVGSITCEANAEVANNYVGNHLVTGSKGKVIGNHVLGILAVDDNCMVSNNYIEGTAGVTAGVRRQTVFSSNIIVGNLQLADSCTAIGNLLVGSSTIILHDGCLIQGNYFSFLSDAGVTYSGLDISGNRIVNAFNVAFENSIVRGNTILDPDVPTIIKGDFNIVSENQLSNHLGLVGGGCAVNSNYVNGYIAVDGDGCAVNSNYVNGNIAVDGFGHTVMGNRISGDIISIAWDNSSLGNSTILGNYCNQILLDRQGCVIVGNRTANGISNPTAPNQIPTNTIVVGNFVNGGTGVFGVAPDGVGVENNV